MVSYIQNDMQPSLDAFIAVMQKLIPEKNLKLKGSYEHLPIMQFILIERYEGVEQRAFALKALRSAGLPDEIALELCNFDTGIILNELIQSDIQDENNGQKRRRKQILIEQNGHKVHVEAEE